eukprot:CAMPEP_0115691582 /NCGR_PEP_ID=MMETSP0272-20121206/62731_1 /TAXON_ID=71861 /ORGANISM="Scrippsiella trochoidea, Strain CCMP3099" /LENGTH=360 /DNA_ID=CAMNT_0003131567 /DNA_START=50 /DNA_END=1128 /DNA_ORIENTATION=+
MSSIAVSHLQRPSRSLRRYGGRSLVAAAAGALCVLLPSAPKLLTFTSVHRRPAAATVAGVRFVGRKAEGGGHAVPKGSAVSQENMDPEILAFREHQKNAARLSFAEEARTLVNSAISGVMSTVSARQGTEGYPSGSVVFFATDEQGRPIFSFSSMSGHTVDLKKNEKASLTILAPGFASPADARVTITGTAAPVNDDEKEAVKAAYKEKHPNAFWTEFGDFKWHRMEVEAASLVGGFARAGGITAEEYAAAKPDPVAPFSGPIAGHMNDDHGDATLAIVKGTTGLKKGIVGAKLLTIDRLGMNVLVEREDKPEGAEEPNKQSFKVRVPFPSPAENRKEVKDRIVQMTRAAAAQEQEEAAP